MTEAVEKPKTRRGTSNSNERGNSEARRRRREWLVMTYRADCDLGGYLNDPTSPRPWWIGVPLGEGVPACRCYRCGDLLSVDTVQVDRIIPGCKGGKYRRDNIRPNCKQCSESTGGVLGNEQRKKNGNRKKD